MSTNTNHRDLLDKAATYVRVLFQSELPQQFYYHNLQHTEEVVRMSKVIGEQEGLDAEGLLTVQIAAWFHDVGYAYTQEAHEKRSIKEAKTLLSGLAADQQLIDQVSRCIEATIMPQSPKDLMGEVICDADLYHLSSEEFFDRAELLKMEMNEVQKAGLSKKKWLKMNVGFLTSHRYFTQYAQQNFEPNKQSNLNTLKKKILSTNKQVKKLQETIGKLQEKLESSKNKTPTRGIETMFRLTSKNHLDLSAMADNKANIMISINSIILSIVVSVLVRKLEEYPHFIIPTIVLTVVCLITIVLAILATRPNVSKGIFTKDDIMNKKTNLLFFGNFHAMSLEEYEWGMKELMKDSDYLYGSLIKDIYYLGAVLGQKYRLLRATYTCFMFGFVVAVISFILAEVYLKSLYMY